MIDLGVPVTLDCTVEFSTLSLSLSLQAPRLRPALLAELVYIDRVPHGMASSEGTGAFHTMDLFLR